MGGRCGEHFQGTQTWGALATTGRAAPGARAAGPAPPTALTAPTSSPAAPAPLFRLLPGVAARRAATSCAVTPRLPASVCGAGEGQGRCEVVLQCHAHQHQLAGANRQLSRFKHSHSRHPPSGLPRHRSRPEARPLQRLRPGGWLWMRRRPPPAVKGQVQWGAVVGTVACSPGLNAG